MRGDRTEWNYPGRNVPSRRFRAALGALYQFDPVAVRVVDEGDDDVVVSPEMVEIRILQ